MVYFEGARAAFSEACGSIIEYNEESKFYHKLAHMIPDKVDVDTLILALKVALDDATLDGENTLPFIAIIPQYVRQCTSKEFAHEFREKFNAEILGLTQEDLPDVDYGYVEVEKDVIDISNKNRGDVLAALYNASTPVGTGFMQYNPMPLNGEMGEMYLRCFTDIDRNGYASIKYIKGRLLPCTFKDNLVYVAEYNNNIEDGLAQRAIATCPNVEKTYRR